MLVLTVHISSLFGYLPLNGVVWWRGYEWGFFCGNHNPWSDVGFECGYWWLLSWDEGLSSGNCWFAWKWGDCPGGRRGFSCSCEWWFWNNGEGFLWSYWWADCGNPFVIQVWDVVVMIGRQFAWSRGVNNHLWNGCNDKRMQMEGWKMST